MRHVIGCVAYGGVPGAYVAVRALWLILGVLQYALSALLRLERRTALRILGYAVTPGNFVLRASQRIGFLATHPENNDGTTDQSKS